LRLEAKNGVAAWCGVFVEQVSQVFSQSLFAYLNWDDEIGWAARTIAPRIKGLPRPRLPSDADDLAEDVGSASNYWPTA